jgi:hypothetical protein
MRKVCRKVQEIPETETIMPMGKMANEAMYEEVNDDDEMSDYYDSDEDSSYYADDDDDEEYECEADF